jgi:hypothetical protein
MADKKLLISYEAPAFPASYEELLSLIPPELRGE